MNYANAFGNYFRERRLSCGKSLRQFCLENGLDAGNISKLERGFLSPPTSKDKLEKYAKMLGIEPGSNEWYEFFDYAAACKGEIPADLMSDEQLIEKLPLVFRTIRGQRVSPEQLDKLAELIRKS